MAAKKPAKKPWTLAQVLEFFATEDSRADTRKFEAKYARCVKRLKTKATRLPIEKRNARMERGYKDLGRKFGYWPPNLPDGISSKNPKTRELMAALRSGEVTLSGLSGSIAGPHTKASPGDFATEWEFQPRACNGAGIAIRLATRLNPAVEFYYCEIEHAREPKAKRGPKEKYTWPPVEQKVFRLMDKPRDLGIIGEAHLRAKFESAGAAPESFYYKRSEIEYDGVPYLAEAAFGYCPKGINERRIVSAVNWSPAINADPFRRLGDLGQSLGAILTKQRAGPDEPIITVLHLACPRVEYLDRGKSSVNLP